MDLKKEWEDLKSNLTEEQQTDGMRCFYCGALSVLAELNKPFSMEEISEMEKQIREILIVENILEH